MFRQAVFSVLVQSGILRANEVSCMRSSILARAHDAKRVEKEVTAEAEGCEERMGCLADTAGFKYAYGRRYVWMASASPDLLKRVRVDSHHAVGENAHPHLFK